MLHALGEYAAVAAVLCALGGIGTLPARLLDRAVGPPRLLRAPLLTIAGLGIVALLSAVGALVRADQTWPARTVLAVGWLLLLPIRRETRGAQIGLMGDLLLLVLLAAPMALLVAGTPASAFDEFAQWLPNTRYLVEHAHYWTWPDWVGASSKPGYPNASAVVALLVVQLAGPDVEAPFKVFAAILLAAFGAVLASLFASRWPTDRPPAVKAMLVRIVLVTGGCLVAFLDPFMDPRIGFTAYTDVPSAITIAIAMLAAASGLGAAQRGAERVAGGWFGWAGLLSLTLILLRQTNLILVAAMASGCSLLLLVPPAGTFRLRFRWVLALVAPPAIGGLVWQAHLWAARIRPDISPRPIGAWDWAAPLTVMRAFVLDRLGGNPLLGGGAIVVAGIAIAGGVVAWRRLGASDDPDTPPARLVVTLTAMIGCGFIAFLGWSYIAVFSAIEVATAASLWRYLSELGPLVVVSACCVAAALVAKQHPSRRALVPAAAIAVGLLFLLPYAGRRYYRLDCRFPDVAAARSAIVELGPALLPFASPPPHPARVAVINPTMGDWMAYALAFDMHWPASNEIVRFRTGKEPLAATEAWAWDHGIDALLDLTALDRAKLREQGVVPALSLLGRPAAAGNPWPLLATTKPHALPDCRAWGR